MKDLKDLKEFVKELIKDNDTQLSNEVYTYVENVAGEHTIEARVDWSNNDFSIEFDMFTKWEVEYESEEGGYYTAELKTIELDDLCVYFDDDRETLYLEADAEFSEMIAQFINQ